MKKWIIALIAALSFSSLADAASFGVKLGFPLGVQYSTFDPNEGTGFRIAVLSSFFLDVRGQVDFIFGRIALSPDLPLSFYYGAGGHVGLGFYGLGLFLGAQGTLGLEYLLQPGLSIGTDISAGVSIYPAGFGGPIAPILPYFGGGLFLNFKI